jgi:hypothetical protein
MKREHKISHLNYDTTDNSTLHVFIFLGIMTVIASIVVYFFG